MVQVSTLQSIPNNNNNVDVMIMMIIIAITIKIMMVIIIIIRRLTGKHIHRLKNDILNRSCV